MKLTLFQITTYLQIRFFLIYLIILIVVDFILLIFSRNINKKVYYLHDNCAFFALNFSKKSKDYYELIDKCS